MFIKIDFSQPIEIDDFSFFIKGIKELFETSNKNKDYNLYIKEIKQGSIETILTAMSKYAIDHPELIISFFTLIRDSISHFKSSSSKDRYSTKQTKAINSINKIIANDDKSKVDISLKDNKGSLYKDCTFNFYSGEAKNVVDNTQKALLLEEYNNPLQKVLFGWDKVSITTNTGNKIFIPTIDKKAYPATFNNLEDRDFCIHLEGWEKNLYTADIQVILIGNSIKAYQVLNVYKDDNYIIKYEEE